MGRSSYLDFVLVKYLIKPIIIALYPGQFQGVASFQLVFKQFCTSPVGDHLILSCHFSIGKDEQQSLGGEV